MNEGRGETLQDKANGGTLTLYGSSWTTPSGYSLHLDGNTVVKLDQNLLSRSNIQDYSLMFWFRTREYYAGLFSAGWDGSKGTLVTLENGQKVAAKSTKPTFRVAQLFRRGLASLCNHGEPYLQQRLDLCGWRVGEHFLHRQPLRSLG